MMHRNRKWFALIPLVAAAALALFGWIVMLLWNAILVPAAGAGVITFWQGVGLLILSKILFGGMGKGGGGKWNAGRKWKEKWSNMNEDERARFKQEWQMRCGKFSRTGSQPSASGNETTESTIQ